MAHRWRAAVLLLPIAMQVGCGSVGTEEGTQLLFANLEEDLPPEARRRLVGVLVADPVEVTFPDGEGRVSFEVASVRMAATSDTGMQVDLSRAPSHLRSFRVIVVDAAGYDLTAALVGNPTNSGTEDAPEHTRVVQVTRTKSGLGGTSTSQMSVRVHPSGVTRL